VSPEAAGYRDGWILAPPASDDPGYLRAHAEGLQDRKAADKRRPYNVTLALNSRRKPGPRPAWAPEAPPAVQESRVAMG